VVFGGLVRVGLLGPVRVEVPGRVLGPGDLGGRKPKQLLEILLVHQGEAVPKERIADLLWGESLPRDPMRTLEAYVSGVRARLHDDPARARQLLRSESGAYRFGLDGADVDLWRFDELATQAAAAPDDDRLALREEALGLIRGELLADEPYAEWTLPLRALYDERRIDMLLDAAHDCLRAKEPAAALRYAEEALNAQPLRERAHRLVMVARYAMGDQELALNAYTRCRQVLAEGLGVSPLPETERVYLGVLNQDQLDAILSGTPSQTRLAAPRTRYARSGDAAIAYQVVGDGPLDVVFAPGWFSHVEVGWEEPRYAAFLRRLAKHRRLLLFDKRGVGMSDPAPPSVTIDERADDMLAVMDAAGAERAVIIGVSEGGPMGISLAARHPERVAGLVIYSGFACAKRCDDYPWAWAPEFYDLYKSSLEQFWMTGRGVEFAMPSVSQDETFMEWIGRFMRLSVSLGTAKTVIDLCSVTDVRPSLPEVRTPTLVLHRRDEQWCRPENGRYLAERIAAARLVELPGTDHWPWLGDSESVLREVETFLDAQAR
jgi:pimeloyl-ACP methyl ester carboxylesterase/DNA-binding SARP family transcriptional activator